MIKVRFSHTLIATMIIITLTYIDNRGKFHLISGCLVGQLPVYKMLSLSFYLSWQRESVECFLSSREILFIFFSLFSLLLPLLLLYVSVYVSSQNASGFIVSFNSRASFFPSIIEQRIIITILNKLENVFLSLSFFIIG